MAGGQQVKRSVTTNISQRSSFTSAPRGLGAKSTGDCTLGIGRHESCSLRYGFTGFFYTEADSRYISFVVSNDGRVPEFTQMAWLGEEFGNAQEMKKELKANCKVVFVVVVVAVLIADTQVCLQSAPGRSREPVMKMKQ